MDKSKERISDEIIAENLPNLGRDMDIQIYKGQRTPSRYNNERILKEFLKQQKENTKARFRGLLSGGQQISEQKPCRPGENRMTHSES